MKKFDVEVLKIVRKILLDKRTMYIQTKWTPSNFNYSLCAILADNFAGDIHDEFQEYINEANKDFEWYFDSWGGKSINNSWWHWKKQEYQARADWLNEHIKLNK